MSTRRKTNGRPWSRSTDGKARRYLELQEQAKAIDKEMSELKEEFKASGSVSTLSYTIAVVPTKREGMAGLKDCELALGRKVLEDFNLIRVSEFDRVVVTAHVRRETESA